MALINFIDKITTITASWLNLVDNFVNGSGTPPNARTAAEIAAGVTPTNFAYPPGHVFRYGALGNGVANDTVAISNALLAAAAALNANQVGLGTATARVYLPSGNYITSATLNRPAGVYIVGDGPEATSITANGNFPIIATTGTSSNVLNRGGVQNMCLNGTWGANNANTNSIGISESWTNRSIHRDVRFHGCFQGFYGLALWQVVWDNLQADGQGTQQNNVGFFLDQLPTTFPSGTSNSVKASGCVAQNVATVGFQLKNPNGSFFVSCEAMNGVVGFDIGNTSAGCYPCQFAQFVNCTSDTNSGNGWQIRQGNNASPCTYIQLANCWGSTHGQNGFFLSGCAYINLCNLQSGNNQQSAVVLSSCQYCEVTSSEFQQNNQSNVNNIGDIVISGGSFNYISGNTSNMAFASSPSLLETNATNSNTIVDNRLFQSATIIGANTFAARNQGYRTENIGVATILAASTSIVVNHGLAITPALDSILVTPQSTWGTTTAWWVSNPTSTQFTINCNPAPGGGGLEFNWRINLNKTY